MKNNRRMASHVAAGVALAALLALAGCASNAPAPVDVRAAPAAARPPAVAAEAKDTYVVKSGDTLYSIAREHGMDYRELIAMNRIENASRITPGAVLKIRPPAGVGAAVASTAPITADVVVARPLAASPGPAASSNTETLKREPKGGKLPYSEQALAQAQTQAKAGESAAPTAAEAKPEARPEAKPEVKPEAKPEAKPAEPALAGDELPWIWPARGQLIGTFSEGGSKGVDIAGRLGDPVIAAADGKIVYSGTGLRGYGKLVIIKHNTTYLSAYAHNQTILVKEGQSVTRGQKIAEMGNSDADQVKLHFEVRRQGKPVDPMKYLPQR
jgi:lipoprotein NlpD